MTRLKRTAIAAVLAMCLTVSVGVPALALDAFDENEPVRVTTSMGDPVHQEDLAAAHEKYASTGVSELKVYKAASMDTNGVFTAEPGFEALTELEDWNDGVLTTNTSMETLTETVIGIVTAATAPAASPAPAEGEGEGEAAPAEPTAGITPVLTIEDFVVTDGLIELEAEHGLYLLMFGEAVSGQWVYTFQPIVLALPSIEQTVDAAGQVVPGEGKWLFDPAVQLKATRVRRLGDLEITKALQTYNATLGPTTFVFAVEGRMPDTDEKVYSNVVSLTFSGAGIDHVELHDIPIGAEVTVTEVYSGASYEVSGSDALTVEIPELELPDGENVARVGFTNDYTDRMQPDVSVTNTFVYGTSGWVWQRDGASEEVEG